MSKTPNALEIHRMKFIAEVPRWHYRHANTPTWRFYWNPLPGAWLKSGDKTIELLPETAVLIPPQTPFAAGADKPFSHFFVHFSIPLYCNPDKRQIWTLKSKDVILEEFQKELPHLSGQRMFWTAASIVQAALTRLPQDVFSECEPERENLFDKAVKFLDQDHAYSLSYAELAHLCGTSINTLHRQFASATGLSIRKWQLNRKMEKAVQLLLHDGFSIKETADMLGFADRYHFSKAFKHYFGISPAQFVKSGGIPLP